MSRLLRAVMLTLLLAFSATAHALTYTLAGGPSPSDGVGNDDEITVYVNNVQVGYENCCNKGPIVFNGNPGDTLHITVNNDGGPESINPLYLFIAGTYKVLDPVGVPVGGDMPSGIFYDRTFTLPAIPTIPTLSEWGMIILTGLLALGAVFTLRRQRQ